MFDKPMIHDKARTRDVYNERIYYELEQFTGNFNDMQNECVKHAVDCAYLEGYLDGMRFIELIYQKIT